MITPPGRAAARGIRSSLFVFPSDLVDEGVDRVLARVRERGVDAVTLAVAYHQARDLTPRSPLRRLVYRRDGVFVPLPASLWDGVLRPGHPDTPDQQNLSEKVAGCAALGVDAVDFYNYGLYPWPVLDRIPGALRPSTR